VKGPNLHGREAAQTFEAATDRLVDRLERSIERERDKKVQEPRRRAQAAEPLRRCRSRRSSRALRTGD
jgi:ribosome-associated translation inhibitor RaiA